MKNLITALLILLVFSLSVVFAQTEQQLTAEAEKVARDYVSRNVNTVRDKVLASDSKEKAEEQAMTILKIEPLNPTILFALGQVYANKGGTKREPLEDAVFISYIEALPNDPNGYYNYAAYLSNIGYVAEADKYYAKSLELTAVPFYGQHFWRGRAAFQSGNYRQCAESMTKALQLAPEQGNHRWTYVHLSWCQSLSGDKANAEANMQKAISIGGDEVRNHPEVKSGAYLVSSFKCGDASQMIGNYVNRNYTDLSVKYYDFFQLRSCHPNNKTVMELGSKIVGENSYLAYWKAVYEARKKEISSRESKNSVISDIENLENSTRSSGIYTYMTGKIYDREFDEALKASVNLLLLAPKDDSAYLQRAIAFLEIPEFKILAWREANRALALKPNQSSAKAVRARVYYEVKNNADKALAEINEAIRNELNKPSADLYLLRGKIYYGKKEYAKAVSDFDTVLKLEPKNSDAANYRNLAVNPANNAGSVPKDSPNLTISGAKQELLVLVDKETDWLKRTADFQKKYQQSFLDRVGGATPEERTQLAKFKKEGEELIAGYKNFSSKYQSVLQTSGDGKLFQDSANSSINSINEMLGYINRLLKS